MHVIALLIFFTLTVGCGPAAVESDAGAPRPDAGDTADAGAADAAAPDAALDAGDGGPATWSHADVDRGAFPSIAVSADGAVHIAHVLVFTDGTGEIRYSVGDSVTSSWETTVVEAGERVGWNVALALHEGMPVLARTDPFEIVGASGEVFVHRLDAGGDWTRESVGTSDAGLSLGAAASADGLTLAYQARGGMHIARDDTGSWITAPIEAGGVAARGAPALALDADGGAHLAYADGAEVGYARQEGAGWSLHAVEVTPDASSFVDLAFGPDGRPWVAYEVDGAVRVAQREATGWVSSEALSGYDPYALALVVDTAGVVHVAFNDRTTFAVVHARSDDGWTPETIADSGSFSGPVDIATGPIGALHIAYSQIDGSRTTLRLATLR